MVLPVTTNQSDIAVTAIFTTTQQPPPQTVYSITVNSNDLNGTAVGGFRIDLRVEGYVVQTGFSPVTFRNLEPGIEYQVVTYWFGNYYLREFANGDFNRYDIVKFNSTGATSVTLDALYQYVPASQAATLNIMAFFPNGTQLGTTFNNTGYIQHTPGMWLTVTPPGSNTPFTGTYTGGSILPFVLLSGGNYTVQMTGSYGNIQFSHWNDTGSTNPVRAVMLNGNVTLVAIYTQGGMAPQSPSPGRLFAVTMSTSLGALPVLLTYGRKSNPAHSKSKKD